jgi:hypothetical protein
MPSIINNNKKANLFYVIVIFPKGSLLKCVAGVGGPIKKLPANFFDDAHKKKII